MNNQNKKNDELPDVDVSTGEEQAVKGGALALDTVVQATPGLTPFTPVVPVLDLRSVPSTVMCPW
jgi:hypothetical protein